MQMQRPLREGGSGRGEAGYAGRHCIFVSHTHAHIHTHTCIRMHTHACMWAFSIWFIFILTSVVLLVFSTDIIFFALFFVVFSLFVLVYFQPRLLGGQQASAGKLRIRPVRSPALRPEPECYENAMHIRRTDGAEQDGTGRNGTAG